MDERVIERMVARSGQTMKNSSALALAGGSIFVTAIFWAVLRVLLGSVGGVFRLPLFFLTASFAILPTVLVFVPLAVWSLTIRSGHEGISLHEVIRERWKHSVALFLYALCVAVVELLFGVAVAVWCGIEALPVLGSAVYVFFSWIPTVITLVMGIVLFLHSIILFVAATTLAQTPRLEQKGLLSEISMVLGHEWVLRLKFLILGVIPSLILYSATTMWTMKGLPQGVEFCASIFRAAAFSALEAPLFLFLIHMAVEADRYIQWLSSRRVG